MELNLYISLLQKKKSGVIFSGNFLSSNKDISSEDIFTKHKGGTKLRLSSKWIAFVLYVLFLKSNKILFLLYWSHFHDPLNSNRLVHTFLI